jgi:hypothetical protein
MTEESYELTEKGEAVLEAFIDAALKKYPNLSREDALTKIKQELSE